MQPIQRHCPIPNPCLTDQIESEPVPWPHQTAALRAKIIFHAEAWASVFHSRLKCWPSHLAMFGRVDDHRGNIYCSLFSINDNVLTSSARQTCGTWIWTLNKLRCFGFSLKSPIWILRSFYKALTQTAAALKKHTVTPLVQEEHTHHREVSAPYMINQVHITNRR